MSCKVIGGEPKIIKLKNGLHTGLINQEKTGERPVDGKDYSYFDIYIKTKDEENEEVELKAGYPMPKKGETLNNNMLLGQLLEKFIGKKIVPEQGYDLDALIMGNVEFQTKKTVKGDKTYTEIIKDTVEPLVEIKTPEVTKENA